MRISATLLESYRLYLSEDWMPEADLIAKIKGEYTRSPEMRLGVAYHALLEKPQRSLSGRYEHDGLVFDDAAIENMLDLIEPAGLFEVKTTKEILVAGAAVTLVTKCDHIIGSRISEFKTTLTSFDSEKYMASVQWKVMALLFEAQLITYHVALLKDEGDRFMLRSLESLNVFPYAQLEQDVRELVREFIGYVRTKKLTEYVLPKVAAAEGR